MQTAFQSVVHNFLHRRQALLRTMSASSTGPVRGSGDAGRGGSWQGRARRGKRSRRQAGERKPKLFVAIPLPLEVIAKLQTIPTHTLPQWRTVSPERLHVTLHFLGNVGVDGVQAALSGVRGKSFEITVRGVGGFPSTEDARVVWAGVESSQGVRDLYAVLKDVLQKGGFRTEDREYMPHITVARCSAAAPRGQHYGDGGGQQVADLIREFQAFESGPFLVTEFVLYESLPNLGASVYCVHGRYSLDAPEDTPAEGFCAQPSGE